MGYVIVSQYAEEHKEENFKIKYGCPFDKDEDIETNVVDKVLNDINTSYIVAIRATRSGTNSTMMDRISNVPHHLKKTFNVMRHIGHCEGSRICPNWQCPKMATRGAPNVCHFIKCRKDME